MYRNNDNSAEYEDEIERLKWELDKANADRIRAENHATWRQFLQDGEQAGGALAMMFISALAMLVVAVAAVELYKWAAYDDTEVYRAHAACAPDIAIITDGKTAVCAAKDGSRRVVEAR